MAAAIANAIKASGVLVSVTPEDFAAILRRTDNPLIVAATGGFFSTHYKYLTSYKGLAFHTQSPTPLMLPIGAEVVNATRVAVR